ncbi:MAG: type II toxin-antitoxin system RatA family toxin [Magnetococcales bacterium]|nr:type II toxin-antitoxin system RatA family toxin [Magnetococcales bacterium]
MPRINLRKDLPFSSQQMYDLVADVESYPQFIPWCTETRKFDIQETQFMAELTVAFKGIRQSFQTLDKIIPGKQIDINLKSGPFRRLTSQWKFVDRGPEACQVVFSIDFQFKNRLMDMTMGPVFSQSSRQMVGAFEKRARQLYGTNNA